MIREGFFEEVTLILSLDDEEPAMKDPREAYCKCRYSMCKSPEVGKCFSCSILSEGPVSLCVTALSGGSTLISGTL